VVELYKGHEVACHTYHHPTISRSPLDQTARQVLADRMQLEGVMGYPVRGLAYPNGSWSPDDRRPAARAGHPLRPRGG